MPSLCLDYFHFELFACELSFGIFGLGSLAWDPWLWSFGLNPWLGILGWGSLAEDLAWDLWLGFFGFRSLGWDLCLWDPWLWICGFGSLAALDLRLGILGEWDPEAEGSAGQELGGPGWQPLVKPLREVG